LQVSAITSFHGNLLRNVELRFLKRAMLLGSPILISVDNRDWIIIERQCRELEVRQVYG